jgi:hypothetical protein
MNGLALFVILLLMFWSGLELGAPGVTYEAVKVAAEIYVAPELPTALASAVQAKQSKLAFH